MTDSPDGRGDNPAPHTPIFTTARLDHDLSGQRRGLLLFPVSLHSENHNNDNLTASMQAINKAHLKHPETNHLNIVVHVSDAIYAFNYMMWDRDLLYKDARAKAEENGRKWIDNHIATITTQLGSVPTIFHWNNWDVKHHVEYDDVLARLRVLHQTEDSPFRAAVEKDVDDFIDRTVWRRKRVDDPRTLKEEETERIRALSREFVLHETAGYTLIGRHLIKDYMQRLQNFSPSDALIISNGSGLQENGIFRLYPGGGTLNAIKWLQKNKSQTAAELRGAEKVKSIEIKLSHIPLTESQLHQTPEGIIYDSTVRAITKRTNGTSIAGAAPVPIDGYKSSTRPTDHPGPENPDTQLAQA